MKIKDDTNEVVFLKKFYGICKAFTAADITLV
jgi:hypothetical protein